MLQEPLDLLPAAVDKQAQLEPVPVDGGDYPVQSVAQVGVRDQVGHVQVFHLILNQVPAVQFLHVHVEPVRLGEKIIYAFFVSFLLSSR